MEFNADDFLDAIDFQCPRLSASANKLISTPKTQLIQRQTSASTIKPILAKRGFDIEFCDINSPLKVQKGTNKDALQRNLFTIKPKKTLEIEDIQRTIIEALKPLIVEIQQLKIEISSLKQENIKFSTQITQDQAKILKKNENIAQETPPPSSKATEKTLQKTIKATYAEITKINSLMTQ
jgi:hypothetical protein